MYRFRRFCGGICFTLAFIGSASAQLVMYDNLAPGNWQLFFPSSVDIGSGEVGDEIVLAPGTPRVADTFIVQYFTQSLSGGEQIRVRFYENDGDLVRGAPAPGSVIYDSFNQPLPQTSGRAEFKLENLNLTLPDSFTWTVQFTGITGTEQAGLAIHGPANVGSSQIGPSDDYWERADDAWDLFNFTTGSPPPASSFGAQFSAVPEPHEWAMLTGVALLAFGVVRRLRTV